MKARTFPLGVDLGRQRTRVALVERGAAGAPELVAVAARATGDDAAAALRDAVRELGTSERRCILGIGPPEASLRAVTFPAMTPRERRRAARFEAARLAGDDDTDVAVTLAPVADRWVLGIARQAAIASRRTTAAAAGLRTVAVDDFALAMARSRHGADGTIDIGSDATRLTIFADPVPYVVHVPTGGEALTAAIADALGIDPTRAEERKRTNGFAGAGEARRDALIGRIVEEIQNARSLTGLDVRRISMAGNGSRVPGLAETFRRAAGIDISLAEIEPRLSATLPADVLRAAGPDWALAIGLALWSNAG